MTTWYEGPLLGFDTETTGVNPFRDRIVTAAIVGRGARGTEQRTWLIDPGVQIPDQAAAIHGISTSYARAHGMAPRRALIEIAAELTAAFRLQVPVVAFNAAFDLTIIERELERHGLPTIAERLGRPLSPVLDPLVLDRGLERDRQGRRQLVDLCAHYDVRGFGRLHTAEADVAATLDILAAQGREYPHLTRRTLSDLHQWQCQQHQRWARTVNERRRRDEIPEADAEWPLHTTVSGQ